MKKARKIPQGEIRDKERTRQNIIDATGEIIRADGFRAVTYTKVAKIAGIDRKLIYDYFGNLEELVACYLKQNDYWDRVENEKIENATEEITKEFMSKLLQEQYNFFESSPKMQNIVLWELMDFNQTLRELVDKREKWGAGVFKMADKTFKGSPVNFRALNAIIIAAIYYLILHAKANGSTVCEIDITKPKGKKAILNTIDQLLEWAYKEAGAAGTYK